MPFRPPIENQEIQGSVNNVVLHFFLNLYNMSFAADVGELTPELQ